MCTISSDCDEISHMSSFGRRTKLTIFCIYVRVLKVPTTFQHLIYLALVFVNGVKSGSSFFPGR